MTTSNKTDGRKRASPDPNSKASAVLNWYREHPGFHRYVTVAEQMGEATHFVAVTSRRLHQRGSLDRHMLDVGRGRPVAHYGVPAAARRRPTGDDQP